MKKQIFGGIAIVAIAVAVALNVNMVNKKSDKTSLLALANVEALAQNESGGDKGTLYGNAAGDRYCCCPGSNSCSAAGCSSSVCN